MFEYLGAKKDINNGRTIYSFGTLNDIMDNAVVNSIEHEIIKIVAENWVKENQNEIFKKLDHQTILNLALAKSAAKVFDEIKK